MIFPSPDFSSDIFYEAQAAEDGTKILGMTIAVFVVVFIILILVCVALPIILILVCCCGVCVAAGVAAGEGPRTREYRVRIRYYIVTIMIHQSRFDKILKNANFSHFIAQMIDNALN